MENRKTKKPNDPLLCRKKESKRGFEVPKKTDNVFEKKKLLLSILLRDCYQKEDL